MNSVVPVIEVELKISKDLCDYCPVLWWHVHPHQDHHGHKVHAHDLRKEQHQNIWTFARWDPDEKFWHCQQQAPESKKDEICYMHILM